MSAVTMNASSLMMPTKGATQCNNRAAMAKAPAMPKVHAARSVLAGQRVSASQPLRMRSTRRGDLAVRAAVVEGLGGLQKVTLKSNEDTAEIYTFGGVCTSWKKNGQDVLYVRPDAKFDKSKPISGGIPHCWPQFGPGEMQVHGFARNMQWECTVASLDECVMTLLPNDESRKMWPHEFKVTQTIRLKGGGLTATLAVTNTDKTPFTFTGSYHTYFACTDISDVKVSGLEGATVMNRLTEKSSTQEGKVAVTGPIDSVYSDVTAPINLDVGGGRSVDIEYSGWPDAVVWSPWTDMASCYQEFVAVENAACKPVTVAPGTTWTGSMSLAVKDIVSFDPQLESFCEENPDALECLVYDD